MPFIADSETTGRFIPDEGRFIPDEVAPSGPSAATHQFTGAVTSPFQPLTAPYSEYQQRVAPGFLPAGTSRRAINAEIERMNAEELRAIDVEHPSVAIPTEVPGTELPRTPIELPRFQADERASLPAKIGVGLYNVGAGLVEFPINPEGAALTAATAGAGTAGGIVSRLAGAGWALYGAKETPRLIEEAKKALETGTPQQKTEALAALGVNTLIAVGGAKTALKPTPLLTPEQVTKAQEQARMAGLPSQEPIALQLAPETTKAIAETPKTPKAPETPPVVLEQPLPPENAPTAPQPSAAGGPEARRTITEDEVAAFESKLTDAQIGKEQTIQGAANASKFPLDVMDLRRGAIAAGWDVAQYDQFLQARIARLQGERPTPPIPEQPVKAAEAVPVAQAKVSEVARTEGKRSAQEIKDELVQRIEQSLVDAVEITPDQKAAIEQTPRPVKYTDAPGYRVEAGLKRPSELEAHRWAVAENARRRAEHVKEVESTGLQRITIEIPGDGTFTIWNTKEALSELLTRAKKLNTKSTSEPPIARRGISKDDKAEVQRLIEQGSGQTGLAGEKGPPGPIEAPSMPKTVEAAPPTSAEPAISFPGIGSLREKQATAKQLGKIKKNDPELWKAITQTLAGKDVPPGQIEKLAKQRFEQQKAAPTPNEPPLGSATFMGIPDPIATTRAVTKLFNQVRQNETVDRITRQVAGESAPHTMAASESSGEALIRFASARGTGRLMGRAKATEVLGAKAKDEAFRKKLGAVIVQDQLLATKQKFQELADKAIDPEEKADYQDMADKAGAAGSPFKTDEAFRAALADPEIQAALQRHREIVQPIAAEAHEMLGGKMMSAGETTGTFANLIAILGEEKTGQIFGGGKGELTRPRKRPSKFFFERKGTAREYETDYQKIASRMVEGNFDEVAKRELYQQLEADGLAVALPLGRPMPEIGGRKSTKFEIQRRGTPGGATQTENLWVREDIARELRQALDVDGPVARAGWVRAASIANTIQLAGPTDAVFHVANMLSSITRSQGGRNFLVDLARKVPGVNIADTITRIAVSAKRVIQDSPEIQRRIAELSDIGAMRPLMERPTPEGLQKLNPFAQKLGGRLIELLDISGRLVREDLFNNLVKRGMVEDTPANRREWVNQLGQYNPRLMPQFQRVMRDFGVSPFVVAGRNFNRNAIRTLLLSQGVKASSPRAWAVMKAIDVAGVAMTLFAIPALLNYWATGNPNGRPGTKVGEIDTGGDTKIDPAQWIGLRRGMRITGIDALANGARWNSSTADTKYAAGRDIVNGLLHPWMGPVPKALSIATTGYGSVGFRESANPKDWGQNLLAAAEQLNPVVKSVVKGWEQKSETAEAGVPEKAGAAITSTAKSLAGSLGIKERRQRTALQQIKGIHDDWLAKHPDKEVREDYARSLTEQRALPKYMPVYSALRERDPEALKKAVKELRDSGVKLSEIRDQLRPRVQSGENAGMEKVLVGPSRKLERQFRNSLTAEQRKLYNDALAERQAQWRWFLRYF